MGCQMRTCIYQVGIYSYVVTWTDDKKTQSCMFFWRGIGLKPPPPVAESEVVLPVILVVN